MADSPQICKLMVDVKERSSVIAYLRTHDLIGKDECPHISVLEGGVSSTTVLVRSAHAGSFVVKQALPKLRVSVDWYSDPSRSHHEATGIQWLSKFCPSGSITPLLFEDQDQHLIVMRAVPTPHPNCT